MTASVLPGRGTSGAELPLNRNFNHRNVSNGNFSDRDFSNGHAAFEARRSWLQDVEDAAWLYEHEELGRCLCCALPVSAESDGLCVDCIQTSTVEDDWADWVDLGTPD